MEFKRGFASDNNSGVHPQIMEAMVAVNQGHVTAYGEDAHSKAAERLFKENFGEQAEVFMVYNGTGANVIAIQALTRSFNAVICAETAHIHVDECGAPEKHSGCKILTVATPDGKLTPQLIQMHLHGFGFEHHAQPKVVSISQTTEMGTVYSLEEIKRLAEFVHRQGLFLHMDGARISNAAASLNCSFKAMTTELGVDVLSFGGTKNGMMFGEAVVFLNSSLAADVKYIRKQTTQLHSKMRFIAAQFMAYFSGELWRKNALHANRMAQLLYQELKDVKGVEITQKVEANGVFARLPQAVIKPLQEAFFFYVWDEHLNEVRWMASFDTTHEDIKKFVARLKELLAHV